MVAYFEENRPNYTVLGIGRKSYHPDDAHLYVVLSKKNDNRCGFCDCWDERERTLHHGRYAIEFLDSFVRLLNQTKMGHVMDRKSLEVAEHVRLYFKASLPQYTVLEVRRISSHPEDSYLWAVSARKNDGTFAVWTAWNESTQSLNHGNYGIKSLEDCEKLMAEYTDDRSYFAVYRYSQNARFQMFIADSEGQARKFCEDHGWEWKDENGFLWSLDYREL